MGRAQKTGCYAHHSEAAARWGKQCVNQSGMQRNVALPNSRFFLIIE
jgi:hypothetical protein